MAVLALTRIYGQRGTAMSEASTELVFITALVILPLIPAVVLFTKLPATGEVSGLLQGLNVKFSGAFAAYLILFVCLLQIRPTDFEHSHVWQVTGRVAFKRAQSEGKPNPNDIRVRVTPPDDRQSGREREGRFRAGAHVEPGRRGRPAGRRRGRADRRRGRRGREFPGQRRCHPLG